MGWTATKQIAAGGVIPLMAALPYHIAVESSDNEPSFSYDPIWQQTRFASSRGYSTCQYEESVGGFISKSRTDTKKDDEQPTNRWLATGKTVAGHGLTP